MARILLVHGAFGGAWVWEPALPGLRDGGHTVETIDLPGAGENTTPVAEVTLEAYGKKICQALSEGPPAVLAGQSMGGMAITQAAARCPEHIRALVYIAAFAPAEGQSLAELVSYPEAADDQVQANLIVEGDPPVGRLTGDAAIHALLNRCTEEQAGWAVERLGAQPIAPFEGRIEVRDDARDRFEALPRAFLFCGDDNSIPPPMQRRMAADRKCDPVLAIDTDHWPWLSRTDEFVAAMNQIISALPQ
jgi:pimeloyl-ACP methyl ester carboxylesterase